MSVLRLERELVEHLKRTVSPGPHKARNVDIVLYFYGFAEAAWPTLESTAQAFHLGSRERVRQILRAALPEGHGTDQALPCLRAAAAVLRSRPLWVASDFRAAIGLDPASRPITPGLVSLLHHLGLIDSYELYDLGLAPLPRSGASAQADGVIARAAAVAPLRPSLQKRAGSAAVWGWSTPPISSALVLTKRRARC